MYDSLFKGLGLEHKDLDRKVDPLYGFSGESVMPVGRVTVKVHAGTVSSPTDFWVLNSYSPYNAILGRPWLHKMKAVPSTLHQRLRFPTPEGIMEVRGDQVTAKQCLIAAAHQKGAISHGPEPEKRYFLLGASLSHELRDGLIALLMEYTDVFAWNPYEAPGVDPAFACHSLNVDPLIRPVVQKGRRISPLHQKALDPSLGRRETCRWLIVATDYFTKWVEAEPLVHITDADSKRFVWKNIITRFGIPRVLVSDNGSQFTSGPFREFCEQYGIRNHFSTPAYPQANGQAESSNKTLLDGIKKRLREGQRKVVIPLEIGLPTIRTEYYDPVTNETSLATDLDLAEERRDSALIHLAAYQNGLRRIYEKRINPRELAVGDLVLRKVMGAKQDPTHGKLGPNWEGPYKIASVAGTGAFMLIGPNNTPVKRPWNICNLKKYYQ
uniref:Integrase catalytic domain-containing protein n=1 Tax=Fagus sylvatica TaxID=28930 RepID=A0A2N9ED03_FAGSY